jgi:hypothetical protein
MGMGWLDLWCGNSRGNYQQLAVKMHPEVRCHRLVLHGDGCLVKKVVVPMVYVRALSVLDACT